MNALFYSLHFSVIFTYNTSRQKWTSVKASCSLECPKFVCLPILTTNTLLVVEIRLDSATLLFICNSISVCSFKFGL